MHIFGPLTLRWIQVLFITWYTEPEIRVRVFSRLDFFSFALCHRWPFVLGFFSRLCPCLCRRWELRLATAAGWLLLAAAVGLLHLTATAGIASTVAAIGLGLLLQSSSGSAALYDAPLTAGSSATSVVGPPRFSSTSAGPPCSSPVQFKIASKLWKIDNLIWVIIYIEYVCDAVYADCHMVLERLTWYDFICHNNCMQLCSLIFLSRFFVNYIYMQIQRYALQWLFCLSSSSDFPFYLSIGNLCGRNKGRSCFVSRTCSFFYCCWRRLLHYLVSELITNEP
jgi:hypothetical protein